MANDVETNKAVVLRYLQAVVDGDAATVDALHHRDAKYWVLGQGDLDRDTYIGAVKGMLMTATKRTVNITGVTAERDRVAVECEGEMVFVDKVYRNIYHHLFVVRDGLIVAAREYMDPGAVTRAFS